MRTEETLSSVWEKHVGAEFAARSADEAVATMTAHSYVNAVPLMIGARGRESVRDYYSNHFLCQLPPDIEIVPVSRTIGQDQIVDEMIIRFTHTIAMDWLLPGIPPTGKRVESPAVAIIKFEGDKIAHEHLYWDQASVLVQVGLLDRTLPVRGGEIAAQVLNPTQPTNELIHRASNNNGRSESRSQTENPMWESYWLAGTRLSVLADPAATEWRYDLVEGWFPAGAQIPSHRHRRYAEQIYVLDGEFTVWAGKRKVVLRPGDDIFIPAGTAHAVHVTGDGPARGLVVASPSGFARLVTEVGTPDDGGGVPPSSATDMDLLHRISAELGDEILGSETFPGLRGC
jgi:carboxymethylenebutenolidase